MKHALSLSLTPDRAPFPSPGTRARESPGASSPRSTHGPPSRGPRGREQSPRRVTSLGPGKGDLPGSRGGRKCGSAPGTPSQASLHRGDGVPGEHEGRARLPEAVRRQPRPGTPGTPNSGGGETIGAREACKAAEPQKAPRERGRARGWSGPQGPARARSLPTWLALRPAGSCGSPRGLGARPSRHRAPIRGNHRAAEASCRDRRECRERSAPAWEG